MDDRNIFDAQKFGCCEAEGAFRGAVPPQRSKAEQILLVVVGSSSRTSSSGSSSTCCSKSSMKGRRPIPSFLLVSPPYFGTWENGVWIQTSYPMSSDVIQSPSICLKQHYISFILHCSNYRHMASVYPKFGHPPIVPKAMVMFGSETTSSILSTVVQGSFNHIFRVGVCSSGYQASSNTQPWHS